MSSRTYTASANFFRKDTYAVGSLDTVFQNTTGKSMIVVVSLNVHRTSSANGEVDVLTDSSNPPTTVVARSLTGIPGGATLNLEFIVLPHNFYKLTTVSGISGLSAWSEWV